MKFLSALGERLRDGLGKTRAAFEEGFARIFQGQELGPDTVEELESILLQADLGLDTAEGFVERVREQSRNGKLTDGDARRALAAHLREALAGAGAPLDLDARPAVVLVVGVNGSGKTTTCGKLAWRLRREGHCGPPRRGRHVPRRGDRAARALGRADRRAGGEPGAGRGSVGRGLRRGEGRAGPRLGDPDRRHRRPASHEVEPHGGAGQGQARHRPAVPGRAARGPARPGRDHRPERHRAGARVPRGHRAHGPRAHEARRHRQGRHRRPDLPGARAARSSSWRPARSPRTWRRSTPTRTSTRWSEPDVRWERAGRRRASATRSGWTARCGSPSGASAGRRRIRWSARCWSGTSASWARARTSGPGDRTPRRSRSRRPGRPPGAPPAT